MSHLRHCTLVCKVSQEVQPWFSRITVCHIFPLKIDMGLATLNITRSTPSISSDEFYCHIATYRIRSCIVYVFGWLLYTIKESSKFESSKPLRHGLLGIRY